MDRRAFLAATGGAIGVSAGCVRVDLAAGVAVDLQEMPFMAGAGAATALNQREVDPADITAEDDIPDALRQPLEQAREDEFVTDTASDDLLLAIDEFRDPKSNYRLEYPYVRLDGTAYVFEARLPTLVVEVSDETVQDYDEDRVFRREWLVENDVDLDEPARGLAQRITYDGPNAPRLPYRTSHVPESIQTFLDDYDYVEDSQGVSPILTDRVDTNPPFTIQVQRLSIGERYDRPVLDPDDLDPTLREFVREVVSASRERPAVPYLVDSVPAGFFDQLQPTGSVRSDPFVRIDGTVYHVAVVEGDHDRLPVEVTTEPLSPGENDRGRFRMTVAVTGDAPGVGAEDVVTLFGHVGLPSVFWLDDGEEAHLLPSDAYEYPVTARPRSKGSTETALVLSLDDTDVTLLAAEDETPSTEWALDVDVNDVRETTVFEDVTVGDEVAATYEIPAAVPPGTYAIPGFFGAWWGGDSTGDRHEGSYPFEVELTVEE